MTCLSSSFSGDFLPFWPELAINFTLPPPLFFPATEQDLCFCASFSLLLSWFAPWLGRSCPTFSENRRPVTNRRLVTAGLSSGSWEGCCRLSCWPRICLHHPGGGITSPAGSHAFLIYFLVLKKHFQSWLIRKGHTGGNYLRVMHVWKPACSTLTLPSNPYQSDWD